MRIGIAGAGAVGRSVAQELLDYGHKVLLIERDRSLIAPEVTYLVTFILSAKRGVILRRPSKRVDDLVDVE